MVEANKFSHVASKVIYLLVGFLVSSCAPSLTGKLAVDSLEKGEARVMLTYLNGGDAFNTKLLDVGSDGYFVATGLEDGDYLLEVILPGYKLKSEKISLKGSQDITIEMEKLSDTEITIFKMHKNRNAASGGGQVRLNIPTY